MGVTQKKGDLGLVKVIENLVEQGIAVSLPISESQKYDLIAEKDNKCKTVQVRYSSLKDGSIYIKLRSIWTNGNGTQYRSRKKDDFDVLAVFCPDTKEVYFLDGQKFSNGIAVFLRVDEPKANKSKCRMTKEYLQFPWHDSEATGDVK
jgi:hypothetical protein